MNAATQAILVDTFNLALLLLAIGLPAYAILRRSSPTASWERAGNVWTGPFHGFDLIVIVLLVLGARAMALGYKGPGDPSGYTAATILSGSLFFVIVAGMVLLLLVIRHAHVTEVFGLDRLRAPVLLAWSFGGLVVCVLLVQGAAWLWKEFLLTPAWNSTGDQTMVKLLRESPDQGLRIAIALSACLLQPVTEEVIFRGYLYPVVKRHTDRPLTAILSALVFAAMHMHIPTLGPLFLLGILLVIAYEMTGSLWVPIGIHALFNTLTVVYQITSST